MANITVLRLMAPPTPFPYESEPRLNALLNHAKNGPNALFMPRVSASFGAW
ncbi:hypothetical protein D3C85_1875370 [compost metagenome]